MQYQIKDNTIIKSISELDDVFHTLPQQLKTEVEEALSGVQEPYGYCIETTEGYIILALSSYHQCSETTGEAVYLNGDRYLSCTSDMSNFAGMEIVSINYDTELTLDQEKCLNDDSWDEPYYCAIKIEVKDPVKSTHRDEIIFVVYNAHNGYYSHSGIYIGLFGVRSEIDI